MFLPAIIDKHFQKMGSRVSRKKIDEDEEIKEVPDDVEDEIDLELLKIRLFWYKLSTLSIYGSSRISSTTTSKN